MGWSFRKNKQNKNSDARSVQISSKVISNASLSGGKAATTGSDIDKVCSTLEIDIKDSRKSKNQDFQPAESEATEAKLRI